MPDIAYVNGRFGSLADAVVSIEDRGFQFGDGVYEVIRTYRGQPFAIEEHLVRSIGAECSGAATFNRADECSVEFLDSRRSAAEPIR